MSVMPSIRRRYYQDYTETCKTETLLLIRADLAKTPQVKNGWESSWEFKRFRRINQVLKSRNQLPKP